MINNLSVPSEIEVKPECIDALRRIARIVHAAQQDVVVQGAYFGVVPFIARDGPEILDVDVQAQVIYLQAAHPFLRESVSQRDVLHAEIGSIFYKAVGNAVVVVGAAGGDSLYLGSVGIGM